MKDNPFNPIPIPDLPLKEAQPAEPPVKPPIPRSTSRPRPIKARRTLKVKTSAVRFVRKTTREAKTRWQRIKGSLRVQLARLNPVQLKRVLIVCGVGAIAAFAISVLAKHTVLIAASVTLLGVAAALKLWSRILRTLGL